MSTAEKFWKFLFFFLSSFFCLYSRAAKNTTIVLWRLILIHLFRYIVNIVAVWYYCKLSYIQALIIYCCFCLWISKAQRCLYFFSKFHAYSSFIARATLYSWASRLSFPFERVLEVLISHRWTKCVLFSQYRGKSSTSDSDKPITSPFLHYLCVNATHITQGGMNFKRDNV